MLGRSILEKNETGESYPIYFYMNLMVLEIITGKWAFFAEMSNYACVSYLLIIVCWSNITVPL